MKKTASNQPKNAFYIYCCGAGDAAAFHSKIFWEDLGKIWAYLVKILGN